MSHETHILIVDDEKNVGLAMMRALKQGDFLVQSCDSAEKALELLKQDPKIELVLTDYSMPGMDGLTFLKKIKKNYPSVIRFMISAFQDFNDVVQGLNDGTIDKYFKKPWENDYLLAQIEEALQEKTYLHDHNGIRANLTTMEFVENLNRFKFLDHFELQIENASREQSIALIVIGIDNMREIYVEHGIKKFQEIRSLVFQETLKAIKNRYYLATIDDSTFGMIMPFHGDAEALIHQVEIILDNLVKPYVLHQHGPIEPLLKVGVSIYPDHGVSADFLLRNAQEALFKSNGDRINLYHPNMPDAF